jgi:tetratricopeptide (TPR) repeat protein
MDEPIAMGSESGAVPRALSSSHSSAAIPLGVSGGENAQDVHEAFSSETQPHTPSEQGASGEHSGIWTGSSASIQLPRPDPGLPHLVIDMPDPNGGSLSAVPVPQILLVLQMARATGELTLSTQALTRRFAFYEGEPGTVFQPPNATDERNLLSTFVWADGEYLFEGKDVPSAQFHFMGDAPELVFRGIEGYLGVNEAAMALGNYLKKFPVQTDNVRRYRRVAGLERLPAFLRTATGAATLEQLISGAGADTEQTLRLAYFAFISGCVIFADAPLDGPIPVDFRIPPVQRSSAPIRPTGPQPSGSPGRTVVNQVEPAPAAKPAPETQSPPPSQPSAASRSIPRAATPQRTPEQTAESAETLQALRLQWEEIARSSPYDVFELEPGCGPDAVDARFYELVRRYHPDRYARAQSPEVQSLAEKLFLHVRNLHVELSNRERGDGPISSDAMRGVDADSGVQRRRRRAAARTGISPRLSTAPGGVPRADGGIGESSGAQARVSAGERIADKLRNLGGSATDPLAQSGAGPAYSGAHAANRSSALRNMTADQALRNARSATEQGNYGKALELLQLARARGGTGVVLEAYSTFLAYTQDYTSAHDAIEALEEAASEVQDTFEKAAILTLAGHLQRREGAYKESEILYKRALKEEPDNESAARWLRHLKRRTGDEEKKKPFSSTFLNKLFTKPK